MLSLLTPLIMIAAADTPASPAYPSPARAINGGRDWVYTSDYPRDALAQMRGGVATVRLTVDREGFVEHCQVVQSSGHADLDAISCQAMGMRGRFEPARNAAGRRIPATVVRQVVWDPRAIVR